MKTRAQLLHVDRRRWRVRSRLRGQRRRRLISFATATAASATRGLAAFSRAADAAIVTIQAFSDAMQRHIGKGTAIPKAMLDHDPGAS